MNTIIETDEVLELPPLNEYEVNDIAQAIVHDADELDALQADCKLDYSKITVVIDQRQVNLFIAFDLARIRSMTGRHDEAEAIHRIITAAIVEDLKPGIRSRDIVWGA